MRRYIFFLIIFTSLVYAGRKYEVDLDGNIRTEGSITCSSITTHQLYVDTITYKTATADILSVNELDVKYRIYSSSVVWILFDRNLYSPYSFDVSNIFSSIGRFGRVYTNELYSRDGTSIVFKSYPDFSLYEARNFVVQNTASLPSTGSEGQLLYSNGKIYWWDGVIWRCVVTNENNFDLMLKKLYPEFLLSHTNNLTGQTYDYLRLYSDYGLGLIEYKNVFPMTSTKHLRFLSSNDFEFISSTGTGKTYIKTDLYITSNTYISGILNTNVIEGDLLLRTPNNLSSIKIYRNNDLSIFPQSGYNLSIYGNINLNGNSINNVNNLQTDSINSNSITSNNITVSSISVSGNMTVGGVLTPYQLSGLRDYYWITISTSIDSLTSNWIEAREDTIIVFIITVNRSSSLISYNFRVVNYEYRTIGQLNRSLQYPDTVNWLETNTVSVFVGKGRKIRFYFTNAYNTTIEIWYYNYSGLKPIGEWF